MNRKYDTETATMLCGCIRLRLRSNATPKYFRANPDNSLETMSFHRSNAPSPEDRRPALSREELELLTTRRENVMEPRVDVPFQVLSIDEIVSTSKI